MKLALLALGLLFFLPPSFSLTMPQLIGSRPSDAVMRYSYNLFYIRFAELVYMRHTEALSGTVACSVIVKYFRFLLCVPIQRIPYQLTVIVICPIHDIFSLAWPRSALYVLIPPLPPSPPWNIFHKKNNITKIERVCFAFSDCVFL